MDDIKSFSEKLVDEYSLMLLNWAYKKLGSREKAEELVQNVWLAVFSAMKKSETSGETIHKPENFIWKTARFVWCRYLRENVRYRMSVPADDIELADEYDFTGALADEEEEKKLISYMRKTVMNLNYAQREVLISFYLDGRTQKEIAGRLGITVSMVKWYLYDTRKKLKEEITSMEKNDKTEFVYRPRRLHMAISGQAVPTLDISFIENSLTKQNICLRCYYHPMTLDELSESLGIPKAYIEKDLDWLVEKEFMLRTKDGYSTSFTIESNKDEEAKYHLYRKHKAALSDVIVGGLTEAQDKIREIGFYGSDKPIEKLLWLLIYRFANYFIDHYFFDGYAEFADQEPPVRPDGGRYFPLGFGNADFDEPKRAADTPEFDYNGTMCSNNFWWFGLYNFGISEIEDMMDAYLPEWEKANNTLSSVLDSGFDASFIDDDDRLTLAKLVQKGFVTLDGGMAYPNFCVFTSKEYARLEKEVYAPLAEKLKGELKNLVNDLSGLYEKRVPSQLSRYRSRFVVLAIHDIAYFSTYFAFEDNRLYKPADKHDGEFLTLMYIKK